ncbi:MAG: hypothetical protein OER86_00820 [Phycisphaerae bacterium]|nr:hypothetical protein [Phycisphaerae bacterium]
MNCARQSHLVILLALAALAAGGCSSKFNQAWDAAAAMNPGPGQITGRWVGTWESESNGHHGGLRCIVSQSGEGTFLAQFHATYARFLTFEYQTLLRGEQRDGAFYFTGEADLGWAAGGLYRYDGYATDLKLYSTYLAEKDRGRYQLARPGSPPPATPD